MNILHLIIYSSTSESVGVSNFIYENMKNVQEKYYSLFEPNIKTYYIKYSKNIDNEEYILENNILHINGIESTPLVPGALDKTIKALHFFKDIKYDYLVRSNISTIINFNNLVDELQKNPIKFYGGGKIFNLQWHGWGITDNKWFNTLFASGTSIILTNDAVVFMMDNKHLLKYDIVDDVSIAIFMKEHKTDIIPEEINEKFFVFTHHFTDNPENLLYNIKSYYENRNIIFFRNKNESNREIDLIQMNILVSLLIEKKI